MTDSRIQWLDPYRGRRESFGHAGVDQIQDLWINIEGTRKRFSMHRITRPILISLLAPGLSGGGPCRPIRYYTIQLPLAPTHSTNTYPVSLPDQPDDLASAAGGLRGSVAKFELDT